MNLKWIRDPMKRNGTTNRRRGIEQPTTEEEYNNQYMCSMDFFENSGTNSLVPVTCAFVVPAAEKNLQIFSSQTT